MCDHLFFHHTYLEDSIVLNLGGLIRFHGGGNCIVGHIVGSTMQEWYCIWILTCKLREILCTGRGPVYVTSRGDCKLLIKNCIWTSWRFLLEENHCTRWSHMSVEWRKAHSCWKGIVHFWLWIKDCICHRVS